MGNCRARYCAFFFRHSTAFLLFRRMPADFNSPPARAAMAVWIRRSGIPAVFIRWTRLLSLRDWANTSPPTGVGSDWRASPKGNGRGTLGYKVRNIGF